MIAIKERPILFSAPMVRAILEDRKTVTRRAIKIQPQMVTDRSIEPWTGDAEVLFKQLQRAGRNCPYGKPGDRLWVRETWYCDHFEVQKGPYLQPADMHDLDQSSEDGELVYAADGLAPYEQEQPTWKPSIHMPRWASRILLEITDVRVERLQDISGDQAQAEGVDAAMCQKYLETAPSRFECKEAVIHGFAGLWQSINGEESWRSNPWVWVVEFKRVQP